jgi:hypothetical protein
MNIEDVKGYGGLGSGKVRDSKAAARGEERVVRLPRPDSASISIAGRAKLAVVQALAERARQADPEREALLAGVRARLAAGELDSAEALQETARRILQDGV